MVQVRAFIKLLGTSITSTFTITISTSSLLVWQFNMFAAQSQRNTFLCTIGITSLFETALHEYLFSISILMLCLNLE